MSHRIKRRQANVAGDTQRRLNFYLRRRGVRLEAAINELINECCQRRYDRRASWSLQNTLEGQARRRVCAALKDKTTFRACQRVRPIRTRRGRGFAGV